MVELVKKEMLEWYNLIVSASQAEEYLKTTNNIFDTVEREDLADQIAKNLTGMSWPMNGDSEEYKKEFYNKLYKIKQ